MSKLDVASPVCFAPDDELFACAAPQAFKAEQYRKDFPILAEMIHGHPLVYLDNAASTQKPRMVIESMQRFMESDYSNIHRGVHELSVRATEKYESARETVRRFIHAKRAEEIVFVRSGTEAINLVAASWGRKFLREGDEVVLTTLEHHSNIVPWQMLREETGIQLRVVPVSDAGEVRLEDVKAAITPRTKLVAVAHVSNVLGTVLPIAEIIKRGRLRSSTVARPSRACRSMCRRLTPIFTRFRATSFTARPASAFCTENMICSKKCRPIKAAAA
jgi:cysteine desulfurase / selenocysteine lyase